MGTYFDISAKVWERTLTSVPKYESYFDNSDKVWERILISVPKYGNVL